MTVGELIEKLKECNPETEVYMDTGDVNLTEVTEINTDRPFIIILE